MTPPAIALVVVGLCIIAAASLVALLKGTGALRRQLAKTDSAPVLKESLFWGVMTGLRVGLLMWVGLLSLSAAILVDAETGSPAADASAALPVVIVTVLPVLVASVLGWSLMAVLLQILWRSGAPPPNSGGM